MDTVYEEFKAKEKREFDEYYVARWQDIKRDPQTNAPIIDGYIIELFDAVMKELPYAVRFEYVPFATTGSRSYDNLTFQVSQGVFDAAVGDITTTAYRSQFVDFTVPFEEGGFTRTQNIQYEMPKDKPTFLEPFTTKLWLIVIALFIFTGMGLWILEHRVNEDFRGSRSEHVGERIVSNLARLVLVVWVFVVLILSSTYTARLSASLTTAKLRRENTDIDMLIRNGDSVGCREGSFIVEYLKNLGFGKSKIVTYNHSEGFDDAMSKGRIQAIFATMPYTNLFLSKYCNKYMKVGSPYSTQGFAFVFPKGSPLVADVSRAIIKLTDNNKKTEIKKRWIPNTACNVDEPDAPDVKRETIDLDRDFFQRISSSGASTWSKVRAMCKHFDQRDPKSFRSSRPNEEYGENESPNVHVYPDRHHRGMVVPVTSEELGRGIKLNFGQHVFDAVIRFATSRAPSSFCFPSLIFSLLENQGFRPHEADIFTRELEWFSLRGQHTTGAWVSSAPVLRAQVTLLNQQIGQLQALSDSFVEAHLLSRKKGGMRNEENDNDDDDAGDAIVVDGDDESAGDNAGVAEKCDAAELARLAKEKRKRTSKKNLKKMTARNEGTSLRRSKRTRTR
ncbi:glutamate receptor 2.2 [Phtheirospermum japonicum]|uniref:Glutamate receptor 2.2 n=1 Tax=Phtheirospermum japonicum TaxID=374723 RepID=A0A830CZM8_9LAMI|nr:glutamate receptor 2.2 [Phtheirospermum japonicum]